MAFDFSDMLEEARISARALRDFSEGLFNPTLRLGITGLSRAGKTVFITALIHGLTRGGRFPVFEPLASGRIARAHLAPQPDDAVPRFDYERHVHTLIDERAWPKSTVDISELRLVIDYQRQNGAERTLTLDIVDYPGEWLLDLPLLNKSYEQWSSESLALSRGSARAALASEWHAYLSGLNARSTSGRTGRARLRQTLHRLFARLPRRAFRHEPVAARPLPDAGQSRRLAGADLCAARRARGRQPAGRIAVGDDAKALSVLQGRRGAAVLPRPFRAARSPGGSGRCAWPHSTRGRTRCSTWRRRWPEFSTASTSAAAASSTRCSARRIDRILFAATKADHLHHTSHDRLEAVLRRAVAHAVMRAEDTGATIDVVALAAIRATREAQVTRDRESLPSILGTPIAGESANGEIFDGNTEVATFPGELPEDPQALFESETAFSGLANGQGEGTDFRFLRFRPPRLAPEGENEAALPHIRLDRALQFLIGDRLQ